MNSFKIITAFIYANAFYLFVCISQQEAREASMQICFGERTWSSNENCIKQSEIITEKMVYYKHERVSLVAHCNLL